MNTRTVLRILRILAALLLCSSYLFSAQANKPLTFTGLVDALRMHGLTNTELTSIVNSRGVDFQLTPERSTELKSAGADAPLLAAIAAAYRGPQISKTKVPQPTSTTQPTPATPIKPATANSPVAPPVSPQPAANTPAVPARPSVSSIRQVKSLYIERMSNNLDEFIRSELSRQIPGRFLLVLRPQEADAIMRGRSSYRDGSISITDPRGTVELWSGRAGDTGIFLTKIHGGEKEIAKRLVGSLRKALE